MSQLNHPNICILHDVGQQNGSDVWSVGVMLFEMAAGARPFQGQTRYELSSAILNQSAPPLPDLVPVELQAVIGRCLAKEPERRYQRAGELHAALEAIQTRSLPQALQQRMARRRWLSVAGVALGAARSALL